MARIERLGGARAVRAVFAARRAAGAGCCVVHGRPRAGGQADEQPGRQAALPRATVVASRRVGSAVQRNRAKRRLRAALLEVGLPPGWDVVVTARPQALDAAFPVLCADLRRALRRLEQASGAQEAGR